MNYKKWHLHAVDGFVSFLKQKLGNKQTQLNSAEFALHEIPSIPNNLIFSKLTGKYAACARLTCKSWKAQIDQLTECLHPKHLNSLQIVAYFSNIQTLDLQFCRNVTDAEIQNLSSLRYLENLNLKRCKEVTDQGMIYLGDSMDRETVAQFEAQLLRRLNILATSSHPIRCISNVSSLSSGAVFSGTAGLPKGPSVIRFDLADATLLRTPVNSFRAEEVVEVTRIFFIRIRGDVFAIRFLRFADASDAQRLIDLFQAFDAVGGGD